MVLTAQDSPSSKLLYAKDLPRYRQMVTAFYKSLDDSPPVSDQQIANFTRLHSQVLCLSVNSYRLKHNKLDKFVDFVY